jgi:hypothetical protein
MFYTYKLLVAAYCIYDVEMCLLLVISSLYTITLINY